MDYDINNNTTSFGVGSFFLGILIGAVVGGITALLMAPQSGTQTRGMVKDRFKRMREIVRPASQEVEQPLEEIES
jgi:gas vesicle protein